MKIKTSIFNNILFDELSPWQPNKIRENTFRDILNNKVRQNKDNPELFFKALIIALKNHLINLNIDHIPSSESIANLAKSAVLQTDFSILQLPVFYNKTTEFYYYLINNEIIRIKAAIASNVKKCPDIIDKEFQVVSLLKSLEYVLEQISLKNYDDRDSIYILNALKLALFRLYEEIKIVYPEFVGSEALTENETTNYIEPDFDANKNKPETLAYTISQYLTNKKATNQKEVTIIKEDQKQDKPLFIPNKTDFRSGYKGKLSYEDIRNVELFSEVEKKLYEYEYINLDYNFTNKHNKKKELAAIFKILISKKYFKEKNIKHHNKFRDADYRQYLDHRYNVDTSQQFRKCAPADIDAMIKKYYWLDNLPICR